jgi:hypothetical protein
MCRRWIPERVISGFCPGQVDRWGWRHHNDHCIVCQRNDCRQSDCSLFCIVRRPFFVMADLAENARRKAEGKKPAVISPLALEAVRRIDELFEIERAINGQSPERRSAVRQELSAPLVANLAEWMREQRAKLSRGDDVAEAMDYMLKR